MKLTAEDFELSLKIANSFCNNHNDIVYCLEEDSFYMYQEGVYKKLHLREMHNLVMNRKEYTKQMSLTGLRNVTERIATIKQRHVSDFNNHNYINFINGLFNIETGELEDHRPEIIATIRLPYSYDAYAISPLWEKTLKEIMENDNNKVRTLQEFFGYCITKDVKYEKALILTGEGANGKSTILHTLEHMVGEENCSALPLKYLNDSQKISVLVNKLVNICGEVSKRIEDFEAEFKTIVTGEKLTVSPKYIKEYTFRPFCKLVMAINEFPYVDDRTSAFYRRLLIIELGRQFGEQEQNKNLRAELLHQLPGIFNWAYEGLVRLRQRNTFVVDEYMRKIIESLKESNNHLIQWSKEQVMVFPGEEIVKAEMYAKYRKWAIDNGYKPYGSAKFGADVYKIFEQYTEKERRSSFGDRPRIWPGIAWRTMENEIRYEELANRTNVKWEE